MTTAEFNTRILVIDDDEVARRSYQDMLAPRRRDSDDLEAAADALFDDDEDGGGGAATAGAEPAAPDVTFLVDEASNGKTGFELVRQAAQNRTPYAAIFLDMRMPGWDGLVTAQQIRQVDENVEIIFATAYADHTIDEVVAKAGAHVGYHCKPFVPEEVRQLATKAVYDWNRLRSLERLLGVVASLRSGQLGEKALRERVLEEVRAVVGGDVTLGETSASGELDVTLGDDVDEEQRYMVRLLLQHAGQAVTDTRNQESAVRRAKLRAVGRAMASLMEWPADEAVELAQDIIDYADEQPLERGPHGLAELLQTLPEATAGVRAASATELVVEPPPETTVSCDAGKLRRALMTLVGSAVREMAGESESPRATGSPEVTVACAVTADRVEVTVRDNGPRLPADALTSLFDPFATASHGSGLGLAVVKHVVEAHGGDIRVETASGGTTYAIRLPRA